MTDNTSHFKEVLCTVKDSSNEANFWHDMFINNLSLISVSMRVNH